MTIQEIIKKFNEATDLRRAADFSRKYECEHRAMFLYEDADEAFALADTAFDALRERDGLDTADLMRIQEARACYLA